MPQPPLSNLEYRDSLSAGSVVYPDWWGKNGGRLIPLESGTGTRIKLTAFYPLELDNDTHCDYWKQAQDTGFMPSSFSWRLWVYGAYHAVTPKHCSAAQDFADFMFYAARGFSAPIPTVEIGELIGSSEAVEVTDSTVTVYVTREMTQKMNVGFFYLGAVVVDGSNNLDGLFLPPEITPADVVRSRPRLPAMWMFLQDASRVHHGNFENIPSGRGALCP